MKKIALDKKDLDDLMEFNKWAVENARKWRNLDLVSELANRVRIKICLEPNENINIYTLVSEEWKSLEIETIETEADCMERRQLDELDGRPEH